MVSVIVPVYNVKDYLGECVDSIIGQTYSDIEMVLVDDGSTDGSGAICDMYARKDKRVRAIHKENGGNTSARKEGIRHCHGEYVAFVDSDDWLEPDMFQKMLSIGTSADIVVSAAYEEYGSYRKVKGSSVKEGFYGVDRMPQLRENMVMNGGFGIHGIPVNLWGKLFKTDVIKEIQLNMPDGIIYGEDAACVYPSVIKADSVYVSNDPLYHYRIRQGSIVRSSSIRTENFNCLYHSLKKHFDGQNMLQLKYFMWQTLLLKAYSKIDSQMALFPFPAVREGMKVAVYGAGLFGQVLRQHCLSSEGIFTGGWFDREYESYGRQGLCVQAPEMALEADFDIMAIAVLNTETARQIKETYVEMGMDAARIDCLDAGILARMDLPFFCTGRK